MRSPQFIQHSVWLRMRILDRRVPRAPLPDTGVTRNGMTSQIIWKGITPSSSLIWTHAPDQSPPRASGFPSHTWSLQVVTSPCWAVALPDIISKTLVQVLGSIPRRDLQVLVPISSLETPASPHGKQVRLTDISLLNSFNREPSFEAAIIRLPSGSYTRLALILSTIAALCTLGSQAFHTTHRLSGYPVQDVASLHDRLGQLSWLVFHQLGRSLVGCSFPHPVPR